MWDYIISLIYERSCQKYLANVVPHQHRWIQPGKEGGSPALRRLEGFYRLSEPDAHLAKRNTAQSCPYIPR
jgi:hypothetical protein